MVYLVETPGKTGVLSDKVRPTASGSAPSRRRSRSTSRWPARRPPARRSTCASRCSRSSAGRRRASASSRAPSGTCRCGSRPRRRPARRSRSRRRSRREGLRGSSRRTDDIAEWAKPTGIPGVDIGGFRPTRDEFGSSSSASLPSVEGRWRRRRAAGGRSAGRRRGPGLPGRSGARGTRGPGASVASSAPSSASRWRTRARRASSMSRARSLATRASCERAKIASAVSRPGGNGRSSRASSQRSAASLRTAVLARPVERHPAPSRPRHQSAVAFGIGGRSLTSTEPSDSLISGESRSRLAAHRHISASSWGSGLGRPDFLAGLAALGREQERGEPAVDLVVVRPGPARPRPAARGPTTRPSTGRP